MIIDLFTDFGGPLIYRDVKFEFIPAGPLIGRAIIPESELTRQLILKRVFSSLVFGGCQASRVFIN